MLFDVGRRRAGLASIAVPRAVGGQLVVRTSVPRARQVRFVVTLNGRRIERRFDGQPGPVVRLRLGADEGLRHGRNTVRVLILDRGGAYTELTRRFTISPALPIAAAGPDRAVRTGVPVTLTARGSLPAAGRGTLSYRWSVVSGPTPLLPLAAPASPTLRLTPDQVGTYALRLTVIQRGGANAGATSSDLVTLTSQPVTPPIGVPVQTGSAASGQPAVSVGGTPYPLASGDAVIVLGFDRATLQQQLPTTSFAANEASGALSAIRSAASGRSLLVMLFNPTGTPPTLGAWSRVVAAAGGKASPGYFTGGGSGFSVIGVAGDAGNAYQSFPPANVAPAMSGYLQVGGNGFQYRFAASKYPSFNTSAAASGLSNTMTIGGSTYTSDAMPACATGGFQWVIVSALTLELQVAGTTATNGCGADDVQAQFGLATNLRGLPLDADRQPSLVFLQSIGAPRDITTAGAASSWNALTAAVASLGGTTEVFWSAGASASQPYALVGSSPGGPPRSAAEASAALTGGPGVLSGLLRRGHDWKFLPSMATPGTTAVPVAAQIAYQAPTVWPLSSTPAQIAAMDWIAQQLDLVPNSANSCEIPAPPGPRGLYCTDEGWSNQRQSLAALQYSANPSFTATDLTAAKAQLDTEFNYVANIYTSSAQLTSILGQQSKKAKVDLNTITQQVVADVDADGELTADLTQLVSDLLSGATYFLPDAGEQVAGALASILQVAVYTGEDPQSGLPLSAQVQARAKDLGTSMDAYFQNADDGVKHVTDIIVSDWGKLSAAAANPGFQPVSSRTQERLVTLSEGAIGGWIWGKLMPMAYQLDILHAGKLNPDPSNRPPTPAPCRAHSARW